MLQVPLLGLFLFLPIRHIILLYFFIGRIINIFSRKATFLRLPAGLGKDGAGSVYPFGLEKSLYETGKRNERKTLK
jgi:hypothetical protein